MQKIRIFGEEDRLKVAAIMVKNGYRVEQRKEPRIGTGGRPTKSLDYVLILEDVRTEE